MASMAIVTSTVQSSSTGENFGVDQQKAPHQSDKGAILLCQVCLVSLGLDDFLAAIVTAWADVVAQMRLTSGWLHCQCGCSQKIVCAMHTTLGRGLLILLNGHDNSLQN